MIETKKFKMIYSVCYPPYQCRVQSEAMVFDPAVYFRYIHIDGDTVGAANIFIVGNLEGAV